MRIALYQGTSRISRLIRWQTRSRYSHAAFILDDGSLVEAWPPCVRWIGAAEAARLRPYEPYPALSVQHTPGTVVDIFDFVEPLTDAERKSLTIAVLQDEGTPYDWRSVLRFATRKQADGSGRKLFCSEQVFLRCAQIGRRLLARTEAWRVPPDWIARSPLLKLTQTVTTR